eukprot:3071696-Pleurochrysis_carterae.AAC.1
MGLRSISSIALSGSAQQHRSERIWPFPSTSGFICVQAKGNACTHILVFDEPVHWRVADAAVRAA